MNKTTKQIECTCERTLGDNPKCPEHKDEHPGFKAMRYPRRPKGCDCRYTWGADPRCTLHGNQDRVTAHDKPGNGCANPYYCDICRGGQDQTGFNSSMD